MVWNICMIILMTILWFSIPKRWVNIYLTNRAFGGSEEGGWWYNYGIPIIGLSCKRPSFWIWRAQRKARAVCKELNEERITDIGLIASDGNFIVITEPHRPKAWPNLIPHYE